LRCHARRRSNSSWVSGSCSSPSSRESRGRFFASQPLNSWRNASSSSLNLKSIGVILFSCEQPVSLRFEAEIAAAADDMACCRTREMRADDANRLIAEALDKFLSSIDGHFRVDVESANPFGMRNLHRMVNQIAGDDGILAARGNAHADMARSMAGSRFETDFARQPQIGIDQVGETRVDHGTNRVFDRLHIVRAVVKLRPMVPFALPHYVTRLGKGRHPVAVHEHGVPADVIEMEMGADDGIDRVARESRLFEVREERQVQVVEILEPRTRLVVAHARVDQDAPSFGFHQQGVDTQANFRTGFVDEGLEPFAFAFQVVGRHLAHEHRTVPDRLLLLQLRDLDVTDFPGLHGVYLRVIFLRVVSALSGRTLTRTVPGRQSRQAVFKRRERLRADGVSVLDEVTSRPSWEI